MISRQLGGFFVQRYIRVPLVYRRFSSTLPESSAQSPTSSTSVPSSESPLPAQDGLYPQIKQNLRQLLSDTDSTAALKQLDEIGYAHLNNIRQAEEVTDENGKKRRLDDAEKFPINANQINYMIGLIFESSPPETSWKTAVDFLKMLVQTNLTKLDDNWLKVLAKMILEQTPTKPFRALEAYKELCQFQPYPKVFPVSMFMILSAMRKVEKKNRNYKNALKVVESQGSTAPHVIEGAVLLANNESLKFLDQLKNAHRTLGPNELRQLIRMAVLIKEPKILEPFVQIHRLLPKNHEVCSELYNTLVNLYGQQKDLYALEVLWRSLKLEIPPLDRKHYRHVFQRCRHFYKCNNQKMPDSLTFLLNDLGDF